MIIYFYITAIRQTRSQILNKKKVQIRARNPAIGQGRKWSIIKRGSVRWAGPVCGKFEAAAKTQIGFFASGPWARLRAVSESVLKTPLLTRKKGSLSAQAHVGVKQSHQIPSFFLKKKQNPLDLLFIYQYSYLIIFLFNTTIRNIVRCQFIISLSWLRHRRVINDKFKTARLG